jgi:pyruvate kinase
MTPKARPSAGNGKPWRDTNPDPALRATRIVATIGPRAEHRKYLDGLLKAGADLFRINGAHAKRGEIAARVALIRKIEKTAGRPVGVLLDLGGPKIRVGPLADGQVAWKNGERVEIVPGSGLGSGNRIFITYPALLSDVHPGCEIRIDDGKIQLLVEKRLANSLEARVLGGGVVKTAKGVNFPGSALSAPALTAKDRRDLAEALEAGVDFVGLSFVRSARQVEHLRRLIDAHPEARRPWIVAKIERPEAVADLANIARAADALMVARGDLGVEVGLAAVPRLQRRILEAGRRYAVPVIVATQMLESMIEKATPTRAEVSDVAGAVHDGADAVMLSGETAMGAYPELAVRTMAEIAATAELPDSSDAPPKPRVLPEDFSSIVADAAVRAATTAGAAAIVVYTESGRTARLVSKAHLSIPVFAITTSDHVRRRMTILRNVFSARIPRALSVEEMLRAGDVVLAGIASLRGRTIVEVSGAAYAEGATNTVRLRVVGPARRPTRTAAPRSGRGWRRAPRDRGPRRVPRRR